MRFNDPLGHARSMPSSERVRKIKEREKAVVLLLTLIISYRNNFVRKEIDIE